MSKILFKKLTANEKKEIKGGDDVAVIIGETHDDLSCDKSGPYGRLCDGSPPTPAKQNLCFSS